MEFFTGDADFCVEGEAGFEPIFGELHAVIGVAEVFDFHLLEFTGAEGVVAGVDFVAEGFSDLGDAEGELDAVGIKGVFVLAEDGLGGFWAEVGDLFAGGSEVGLEHEVELAGLGKERAVCGVVCGGVCDFLGGLALKLDGFDGFLFAHHGFADEFGIELAGGFACFCLVLAGKLEDGVGFFCFPCGICDGGSGEMEDCAGLWLDLVGAEAGV